MSEEKRGPTGASQPITRHPLFPAIVALWAGALFGLASLALRPAMIEHAVLSLHIDKVIPMAAPPLGTTMRILVTLAMTALGALTGALLALRIAGSVAPGKPKAQGEVATARRVQVRRRSVSAGAESFTSRPVEVAVPNTQAAILNVADFEVDSFDAEVGAAAIAEPHQHVADDDARPALEAPRRDTPLFMQSTKTAGHEVPEDFGDNADVPPSSSHAADETPAPARTAGSMAAERIASAELDDLSPIELLERLALAMARRREETRLAAATAPITASIAQAAPAQIDPIARPVNEVDFPAAPEQPMPRLPAALRPVGMAAPDEDDAHDTLPGYIPPRHISLKTPDVREEVEDDEGGVLAQGYSSLLDLSRGSPQGEPASNSTPAANGHELEPAPRRFDAPGGNNPEKTEKALREALATLQRMSGAA